MIQAVAVAPAMAWPLRYDLPSAAVLSLAA
jgi:hypothetical protein